MLHIYNSLTRTKAPFVPITPGKVGIYVCGMTVYDYCHLGHARVLVVFDVVVRHLRALGYEVTYVRNITDIDDKIIRRAQENGEDFRALTARFIQAMHEDADRLGVLRPDVEPRASQSLREIIAMIQGLLDQGYAYSADNGDVYYEVGRFARYGVLSGRNLEEERVGARVEVGEAKRDPLDFVLWKAAKPGEPSWDSPWGPGRPGWHIECSAMSTCHLGEHFDIHGGGLDLKFPHHENEIAQTEALTGRPFVNLWMHNGHVQVNEEKMSKSLGNFFTLREIYARYRPEEVRYFLLSSHYRSPLNYSDEQLEQARNALTRFYTALRGLPDAPAPEDDAYGRRFFQAMDDDFNTPEALAVLFDLAREINRLRGEDIRKAAPLGAALRRLGGVLGLLQRDPEEFLKESYGAAPAAPRRATADEDLDAARIERLIAQRAQARRDRHWAESDRIREQLKRHGIVLEDGPGGTTWRRETVKPD